MSKRTVEDVLLDESISKKPKVYEHVKKHTLDSDEEDSDVDESRYNVLDEEDIQGEEDGVSGMDGEVKITPFNMKEELEEGHFDGDGHFQWNKNKEIKDHWLDNLDWVKIKHLDDSKRRTAGEKSGEGSGAAGGGLADSSSDSDDDADEDGKKFDVIAAYRRIRELMQPKETIKRTLQRLGKKSANISSIERFRRKKAGIVDENAALVIELTELTNKILTKLGNMDIYEETYEQISAKFASKLKGGKELLKSGDNKMQLDADDTLDMYADDFDTKEKQQITSGDNTDGDNAQIDDENGESKTDFAEADNNVVLWEFKWKQEDTDCHGPFTTEQMQKWVVDGYFKDGVFVKKSGTESQFHSSNRIDFELYL